MTLGGVLAPYLSHEALNGGSRTHVWTPAATVPTYGANQMVNGGMEINGTWVAVATPSVCAQSNEQAHAGTYSWKVVGDASLDGLLGQALGTVVAGAWYRVRAYIYPVARTDILLYIENGLSSASIIGNKTISGLTTGAWNLITATYRETIGGSVGLASLKLNGADTLYADDFTLERITLASALSSAINVGYKNGRFSCALTLGAYTQAGLFTNLDSPTNPQNYAQAVVDRVAGRARMLTVIAGVTTELVSGAITYVAGARLEIRVSGTTYQLFYNGAQVGTNQTVSGLTGTWVAGFDPAGTGSGLMKAVPA